MKREIKFRGKRIDGVWVYGSYTAMREDDHNECFRTKPHKIYHRIWQWKAGDWNMGGYANYEVIPETVGQFTGLKDKNGKEIYEGDLLRTPPSNKWEELNYSCFEVFFHDGNENSDYNIGYSISRMYNYGAVCGGYVPSFKPKTVSNMVVIGNIHDNPELITNLE